MSKIHVYFMPGLAASSKIFENIKKIKIEFKTKKIKNVLGKMNYDLSQSNEFFKEPNLDVTPITLYIQEGSPFQKKIIMKTPKMNLIEIDINFYKAEADKSCKNITQYVQQVHHNYNLRSKTRQNQKFM